MYFHTGTFKDFLFICEKAIEVSYDSNLSNQFLSNINYQI